MGEKGTFVYRDQYHTGLGKQRRVNAMCELMEKFGEKKMEEGRIEGRAEGRAEGHREGMLDMARSLRKLNIPLEVIEKSSGLTRAEILAL